MLLPNEYQEVEYIESSGTQYIDTDIKLNQSHTIELKLNINSNLNHWDKFYGGGDNGSMLFAQYEQQNSSDPNQNKIKLTNMSSNHMLSTNQVTAGGTHIIRHSNTSFYLDGVLQSTTSATTFTMNTGLNIFAMGNSQSTGFDTSSYKLYYMKIFNSNNSLAYYFIPCYRLSDNVIGLYDLVNSVFYTNEGTGTFTKGADVNGYKIKRVLIWQNNVEKQIYPAGWKPGANTLAYRTLDKDYTGGIITDESGNGRSLTGGQKSGYAYPTLATLGGVNCFLFNKGGYLYPYSGDFSLFSGKQAITISVWVYITQLNGDSFNTIFSLGNTNHHSFTAYYDNSSILILTDHGSDVTASAISLNTWLNLIFTAESNSNTWKICVNGVEQATSGGVSSYAGISGSNFSINEFFWELSSAYPHGIIGYMSNFIIENIEWSAAQKLNYYNSTKSQYGL